MADIRIKDLTTTASSTASDDFIAVDGTTNGTRKLNAFSPTFGGNATVTGTLTANGLLTAAATTSLDGLPTAAIFGATKRIAIGYNTSGDYGFIASADSGTTWKELHLNPSGGLVKVPSTSASTTTSSGALVVSGGLGVGGAIYAGGNITIDKAAPDFTLTRSVNTNSGLIQLTTSTTYDFAIGLRNTTDSDLHIYNYGTSNDALKIARATSAVTLNSTTISTSTSSGALVVSGGVGVAGAVNAGGSIVSNPLHTVARKIEAQIAHSVSTEDYVRVSSNSGTTNTYGGEFGYGLTAGGSPQIKFNRVHAGTVTTWLTVPTSTGDAEFAGSVKTAAPSGGTAAAWKLGTVATVSPTSPNRTIEVDIGGTIYYIHAKTTNN